MLLLALGKTRAAKLLKRFDAEDLKLLSRSVTDLRPVSSPRSRDAGRGVRAEVLSGVNFVGTANGGQGPAVGVMPEEEPPRPAGGARGASRRAGVGEAFAHQGRGAARLPAQGASRRRWPSSSPGSIRRPPPRPSSSFPPDYRASCCAACSASAGCRRGCGRCRGVPRRGAGCLAAIRLARRHCRHPQSAGQDAVGGRAAKPRRGAARRGQGAQEHAVHLRGPGRSCRRRRARPCSTRCRSSGWCSRSRARMPMFQAAILSALASRSRRMVEAELQSGGNARRRAIWPRRAGRSSPPCSR